MVVAPISDVAVNHFIETGEDIVVEEIIQPEEKVEEEEVRPIEEKADETTDKATKEEPEELDYKVVLKEMGYYRDEHTDKSINMRNAVLRFQSDHNLRVDGVFGPHSERTLKKRIEGENYQHPDVISKAPTDKEWITINKTKRILTLYRGNEIIKKYPIAQGKTASLTPEGKFTIVNKVVNPAWGGAGRAQPVAGGSPRNPLGYRWMGLSHKGGGTYGIHGNNSPTSIGTDASLGCVRMINSDVEELFELVQLKTPVWIGTHVKLQEWGVHNKSYSN